MPHIPTELSLHLVLILNLCESSFQFLLIGGSSRTQQDGSPDGRVAIDPRIFDGSWDWGTAADAQALGLEGFGGTTPQRSVKLMWYWAAWASKPSAGRLPLRLTIIV